MCVLAKGIASFRSLPGEMDETDAVRIKRFAEDTVSLAPSTTESIIVDGEGTFRALRNAKLT